MSRVASYAIVAIDAILIVIATYAVLRIGQAIFDREPSPAATQPSAHVAMFWRLWSGAYFAAMMAVLLAMHAKQHLARFVKITSVLVPIVAGLIGLQSIFVP